MYKELKFNAVKKKVCNEHVIVNMVCVKTDFISLN